MVYAFPKKTWWTSFLGVRMQHSYGLYKTIDEILVANPQTERFVEIGTGGGALSVVLALHAVQRETHLLTFDIQIRGHNPKVDRVFDKLDVEFVEEDVFNNVEKIQKHMDDRPTFFFCDGGDKPEEFKKFAPLLPSGSIIGAHDYGKEIKPEQLVGLTDGLEPVFEERWLDPTIELYTCFYKKL
jgi:cephalosporin hydroxylase